MDVLLCNGLGIYCGMKTLAWLSMKPYQWQGLWNIPTYKYDSTLAALNTHTKKNWQDLLHFKMSVTLLTMKFNFSTGSFSLTFVLT